MRSSSEVNAFAVQVLFEEVLHRLKQDYSNDVVDASGPSQTSHMSESNVQNAFNNSQCCWHVCMKNFPQETAQNNNHATCRSSI